MNISKIIKPAKRKLRGLVAGVVAAAFLTGSVVAATTLGVFDRFMEEHDPAFGAYVEPVEKYVIDEGIRVDIIAAQSFGSKVLVYMSVQDISGQNRITAEASAQLNLYLERDDDDGRSRGFFGWSMSQDMMYFDEQTNTAYFEVNITGSRLEIDGAMNLMLREIVLSQSSKEIEFPVALAELSEAPLMRNPRDCNWSAEYILVPSMGENFPELPGDSWISGAAIVDGQLRVQIAAPRRTWMRNEHGDDVIGMFSARLKNVDAADECEWGCCGWVFSVENAWLEVGPDLYMVCDELANELLAELSQHLEDGELSIEEIMAKWEEWSAEHIAYTIQEMVFPLDTENLDSYNLKLMTVVRSSIGGMWSISVDTDGGSDSIRVMSGEPVTVGNHILEFVAVSPLGVSFGGSEIIDADREEEGRTFFLREDSLMNRLVSLEISGGESVELFATTGSGGSGSAEFDEDGNVTRITFDSFIKVAAPIDVSEVTAVIIGDLRVEVE